jgi:hypothetical protein
MSPELKGEAPMSMPILMAGPVPQHNQTVVRPTPGLWPQHNQTLLAMPVLGCLATNHNQTVRT